jgi:hypothetical protein
MRLQLNLLLEKSEGIHYVMGSLPRLLLPVMWFETEADLPEAMAGPLSLLVNMPVIMKGCGLAGIILGLIGMISMLFCLVRLRPDVTDKQELGDRLEDCEFAKVLLKEPDSEQGTIRGSEDSLLP